MNNLSIIIEYLLRDKTNPFEHLSIRDDGNGQFIDHWDADVLGTEPTQAQLVAVEAEAMTWYQAKSNSSIAYADLIELFHFKQQGELKAISRGDHPGLANLSDQPETASSTTRNRQRTIDEVGILLDKAITSKVLELSNAGVSENFNKLIAAIVVCGVITPQDVEKLSNLEPLY